MIAINKKTAQSGTLGVAGAPAAPATFDLAGRIALHADGSLAGALGAAMDPFAAGGETSAPVRLAVRAVAPRPPRGELQNPAGDGTVTAIDGERLVLVAGDGWCTVPVAGEGDAVECTDGFPHGVLLARVIRPAMQLLLPGAGAVALHGTAVETDAGAVIVAGWSESGKTEGALGLLERGSRFISDKWSVVGADGAVSAFPVGVGIRRWVLPHLPQLRAALPSRARAQLAIASGAGSAAAPVVGRAWSSPLARTAAAVAQRALALADRASLAPSEMAAIYGAAPPRVPLRLLALLSTVGGSEIRVREEDPRRAAQRLARSAAYERRTFFDLHDRAVFGGLAQYAGARERLIAAEVALVEQILRDVRVIAVEAPFPADPPRVADAIVRSL